MSTAPHLLTDSEAGDILRMTPRQVDRLARAGQIPVVVLPDGEMRFDADDLWSWIDAHKRSGARP